jgi:hypothetical protein
MERGWKNKETKRLISKWRERTWTINLRPLKREKIKVFKYILAAALRGEPILAAFLQESVGQRGDERRKKHW